MLGVASAATATTAQAADLPVAPEPVDYVRVCDAYGSRFYHIPDTETCLRVGGRLRTQLIGNTDGDIDRWAIDGSVQWQPVSGFVMGADIGYSNTSADISGVDIDDLDELKFGVRMQRTF